jgi:Cu-Zn family superoxide dismutase
MFLAAYTVAMGAQQPAPTAKADLNDAKGVSVGTVALSETPTGVKIVVNVTGLPPGDHGFHVHAVGQCQPPDFKSAGAHFNPSGKKHGMKNPDGPHAGDLENLHVEADGTGKAETTNRLVTLGEGADSLFHAGGTAIVIHAGPDDEMTDPAGNSGARIACGVITR